MTLTERHIETLKSAPFILAPASADPHELCRQGLLSWSEGAWRLTGAGRAFLESLAVADAA